MPLILNNVLYNTNTLFDKVFTHNYTGDLDCIEIIDEPVILMNTLHGCYSHAIMDSCFPVYFMIQELLERNYINNTNVRIFILKNDFINYPNNYNYVDSNIKEYIGSWQNIIEFLTVKPIIFEHLTTVKYLFKNSFIYSTDDRWQRSIWNCVDYYPERNICKKDVIYSDDYICKILKSFRLHIFEKYNIIKDKDKDKDNAGLIIIDRKHNKKINNVLLNVLEQYAKTNINWNYNGTFTLEDIPFSEQIKLFNNTKFFILRHGSSLINLLWCKPGAVIFELEGGPEGTGHPVVTKRLCDFIGLKFVPLNYDNLNPNRDIFDYIELDYKLT